MYYNQLHYWGYLETADHFIKQTIKKTKKLGFNSTLIRKSPHDFSIKKPMIIKLLGLNKSCHFTEHIDNLTWQWLPQDYFSSSLPFWYSLFKPLRSQPSSYILQSCFEGNYTNNSTYETNLNQLLSSLSSNKKINGFYKSSYVQNPDEVYATVLCRGDVKPDVCRTLVKNSTELITQICPNGLRPQQKAFNRYLFLFFAIYVRVTTNSI